MSFTGLTNYHLKLLAAATMVIDHVGVVFYPDNDWLRIVGRISFPLFVWLLVQGETHTRNVWQYGLRLAALGVLSQPLYQIVLDANRPNILFQLLLGLVCLRLTRRFSTFALPIWILGGNRCPAHRNQLRGLWHCPHRHDPVFSTRPDLVGRVGRGTFTLGCGRRTFSASGNWGSDPVLACQR